MRFSKTAHERESLAEALGVFALIMLYIWWIRLYYPWFGFSIPLVVIAGQIARGETARELGFGWKDFRAAAPTVLPWAGVTACAVLASGTLAGTLRRFSFTNLLVGFVLYAVWGVFQQYLLNAFVANRLKEYAGKQDSRSVTLSAALLFSLVHAPNWFLMAVTFAGGYLCVRVYRRFRSLYVLGIAHGLIAFVIYLCVPDAISQHFVIGPRYLIDRYRTYPEWLL